MLLVDGRTASTPTAQYPPTEVQIDVAANGPSRVPFVLYLPVLDTAHPIALPLDAGGFTTVEVKATTPSIPGLEVTIPQGTRITAPADGPQVVSDPGVGLPRFAWHFWDIVRAALKRLWGSLYGLFGGDPIDLATGIFTVDKTDLVLPGRIPVAVRRSYRSDDTRQGFFGI